MSQLTLLLERSPTYLLTSNVAIKCEAGRSPSSSFKVIKGQSELQLHILDSENETKATISLLFFTRFRQTLSEQIAL